MSQPKKGDVVLGNSQLIAALMPLILLGCAATNKQQFYYRGSPVEVVGESDNRVVIEYESGVTQEVSRDALIERR